MGKKRNGSDQLDIKLSVGEAVKRYHVSFSKSSVVVVFCRVKDYLGFPQKEFQGNIMETKNKVHGDQMKPVEHSMGKHER